MDLIKYRDAGMHTYTYFWTVNQRTVSPFFNSEQEAYSWHKSIVDGGALVSTGVDSKDGNTTERVVNTKQT